MGSKVESMKGGEEGLLHQTRCRGQSPEMIIKHNVELMEGSENQLLMGSCHRCANFWMQEYKQKSSKGSAYLITGFSQQELGLQLMKLCVESM